MIDGSEGYDDHEVHEIETSCVCETLMPLAATKSKIAIFRIKVMVKVTRSSTLVSFEGVLLVEYPCQI